MFRKASYFVLWRLPYSFKYQVFNRYLRGVSPYKLIRKGDTVIQVGAPWDILRSGRSRSIHFAFGVGSRGRIFVVEPVAESVEAMKGVLDLLDLYNVIQIPFGAWSHRDTLKFLVDPSHPAANLVDEVFVETRQDRSSFVEQSIEVDAISSLLTGHDIANVRLLSLTTNGSEMKILDGVGATLLAQTEFLSVIDDPRQNSGYASLGFEYYGEDDRGYLLRNKNYKSLG